jgi:hypothetical protein
MVTPEAVFGFLKIGNIERDQLGPTKRTGKAQQEQRAVAQDSAGFC